MNWVAEIVIGVILIILGGILIWKFIPEFLTVIKGAIPLLLIFAGGLFVWIGYEDRVVEKELEKVEKELEEEEKKEEQKKETEGSTQ